MSAVARVRWPALVVGLALLAFGVGLLTSWEADLSAAGAVVAGRLVT